MKAEFLQSAKFLHNVKSKSDDGKEISEQKELFFPIGVHDVPDHIVSHAYFKMLLKDKKIVEPDKHHLSKADSIEERHKKMADKVLGGGSIGEEGAPEEDASLEPLDPEEADGEELEESAEGEPKKKKKHKKS